MIEKPAAHATLQDKAVHEMRLFATIAAYLYVCFGTLIFFKAAILRGEGIGFAPWGIAMVKALVLAKFIMIGDMLHVGDRLKTLPLIWSTAYKAGVFLIFLIVLTLVEEALVGLARGRTITATLAEFGGAKLEETIASCLVMLLILIPFFAFRGIDATLGHGELQRLLFSKRTARE